MAGPDFSQGRQPDAQRNLFLVAFPPPRRGLPWVNSSLRGSPFSGSTLGLVSSLLGHLRRPARPQGAGKGFRYQESGHHVALPSELGQVCSSWHLIFLINRTKELNQMSPRFLSSHFGFFFLARSRDFLPPLSRRVDSGALLPIPLARHFIYT